jgi:hypothetical protein
MTEWYKHEALPLSGRHIRLLEVCQTAGELIECKLHNFQISSSSLKFEFNALSYAWGPPEPTQEIRINGKRFNIRENLWSALDALRRNQMKPIEEILGEKARLQLAIKAELAD